MNYIWVTPAFVAGVIEEKSSIIHNQIDVLCWYRYREVASARGRAREPLPLHHINFQTNDFHCVC